MAKRFRKVIACIAALSVLLHNKIITEDEFVEWLGEYIHDRSE